MRKTKTHFYRMKDIIDNDIDCPLSIDVIPNYMGINLCSVDAVSWQKQSDGQLTSLTIHFIPATEEEKEEQGGRS